MIKEYLLQNWSLILNLSAFAISLQISVFLDKKTVRRMLILIVGVFLLSIVVFVEFEVATSLKYRCLRSILMALRYSATPFIISQIIYTLVKKQTWYVSDICINPEEITALISIDMNGLKVLNDAMGHAAGDEALVTLALCFCRSLKSRQFGYRIGGDEFVILCRKTSEPEMMKLINRIESAVAERKYDCYEQICCNLYHI